MLKLISIASILSTALLLLIIFATGRKRKKEARRQEMLMKRRKSYEFIRAMFHIYAKTPVIRAFLFKLKHRFELLGEVDESFLVVKVTKIISGLIVTGSLFVAVFYAATESMIYTLAFLCFIGYVSDHYIDFFIEQGETRLLMQMLDFIRLVRQKFYEYHRVDDAIYEAVQQLNPNDREMIVQGEKLHNLLLESGKEEFIAEYMEKAPNVYLKMMANFGILTMEYGDDKNHEGSGFLKNLGFLSKNIMLELDKRKKLNYALKSMNIIVVIPLFLIHPIKKWSVTNFAPLSKFYESPSGRFVELLTLLLIVIAMFLLNKIQSNKTKDYKVQKVVLWLHKIKIRLPLIKKIKWLFFALGFSLSFLICIGIIFQAKTGLKEKIFYEDGYFGGNLTTEEVAERQTESYEDYKFIAESTKETTMEMVIRYLDEINSDDENRERRILEKIALYHEYGLRWWHILISCCIGMLGYCLPEINGFLNRKIAEGDREDEVAGFQSIIMMLMNNQRMNVEEIIEWLETYAVHYKQVLSRCLLDISSGEKEAVMAMEDQVENKEMKRLIHQLYMASEDISIQEAFDELIQEKSNFYDQRKWENEKRIVRKVILGQNIGFIPSYGLIILYLIIPMVMSASKELSGFFTQLL